MSNKEKIYKILKEEYSKEYEDIYLESETSMYLIYRATNKKTYQEICLKVIDKKQLELGEYDFLLEKLNREEEITKLCNSENTINFYRKIEKANYIIYELEFFEYNLQTFYENEDMNNELFKLIVIKLANALKILHQKGVMHRDIKPSNIFININEDELEKTVIKLGNFSCSTYIKKNNSEPIGSIFYSAPEILKNVEYDEKCDLWSLGITLYKIYFGFLPYGPDATANKIMNIIYDEKNFIYPKSTIDNLNIFFKRLLTINPKERMTFEEFFDYALSKDFMKKDIICVNGNKKYEQIHKIISQKILNFFLVIYIVVNQKKPWKKKK